MEFTWVDHGEGQPCGARSHKTYFRFIKNGNYFVVNSRISQRAIAACVTSFSFPLNPNEIIFMFVRPQRISRANYRFSYSFAVLRFSIVLNHFSPHKSYQIDSLIESLQYLSLDTLTERPIESHKTTLDTCMQRSSTHQMFKIISTILL